VTVTEEIRRRVDERMSELEPYVKEYDELRRVARALAGGPPVPSRKLGAPGPGLEGHASRTEQALALIREQPGITVTALAGAMGIGTTYLYRLLPRLEREGMLNKRGRGYHIEAS
jgi:hypothetical protein